MDTKVINNSSTNSPVTNFPFLDCGSLPKCFDDEDLLLEIYTKSNFKDTLKKFCKKGRWLGKPTSKNYINQSEFMKLIKSLLNSPDGRKALSEKHSDAALHSAIWHWLGKDAPILQKKILQICNKQNGRYFLQAEALESFIKSEREYVYSNKNQFKYVVIAFAMLQEQDRFKFRDLLFETFPELQEEFDSNSFEKTNHTGVLINNLDAFSKLIESFKESYEFLAKEYFTFNSEIERLKIGVTFETFESNYPEILQVVMDKAKSITSVISETVKFTNVTCGNSNCKNCNSLGLLQFYNFDRKSEIPVIIEEFKNRYEALTKAEHTLFKTMSNLKNLRNEETKIINFAQLEEKPFEYSPNQEFFCDILTIEKKFQAAIEELNSKALDKLSFVKKELIGKITEFIESTSLDDVALKGLNSNELIEEVKKATSIVDIENLNDKFNKITNCCLANANAVSILAKNIDANDASEFDQIYRLCDILIKEKKGDIALFILYFYPDKSLLNGLEARKAIEIILQYLFDNNEPPLHYFFELFRAPTFLGYLTRIEASRFLIERLLILGVFSRLTENPNFKIDISSFYLGAQNTEKLPKIIQEVVAAIVSNKSIRFIDDNLDSGLENIERNIDSLLLFEDGKYRNAQRDAKHYGRFESVIVFPKLIEFWKEVKFKLDNNGIDSLIHMIRESESSDWYLELEKAYDKSLIKHTYYTNVTKNLIESFLQLVKNYVDEYLIASKEDYFLVNKNLVFKALHQWAGDNSKKISFVAYLEQAYQEYESTKVVKLESSILESSGLIRHCPEVVKLVRKQTFINDDNAKLIFDSIIREIKHSYDLGAVKRIYTESAAWGPLSVLCKNEDDFTLYKEKYLEEKEKLYEKSENLLASDNTSLINKFYECFNSGRVSGAYKILEKFNSIIEEAHLKETKEKQAFVNKMLSQLSQIKEGADSQNLSDSWFDELYDKCAVLERILRTILRKEKTSEVAEDYQILPESLIEALSETVANGSEDFSEFTALLEQSKKNSKVDTKAELKIEDVKSECLELVSHWESLISIENIEPKAIRANWEGFVKEFAKSTNLYHDSKDEKKRFGKHISASLDYTFPVYQSAFYKPQSEFLKRPIRFYLYRKEVDITSLQRLEAELESENSISHLHIVFSAQDSKKLKKYFDYDKSFKNFLIIDQEFLLSLCSSKKKDVPLRQALHASVSNLANSSPFVSQGYCHQANNIYVGRKDTLQQLLTNPQAMIWGGRRIGKTSVLHALKNSLLNRKYKVAYVYVDIHDDKDPDLAIAKKIAQTLELGDIKTIASFEKKVNTLRKSGHKLAFLIDEVDEYIKKSRKVHGLEFPLATVLRQLVMDDSDKQTYLVYSGYHQLYYEAKLDKEKKRVGHPFINITQQIPIRDLTYDDIAELLRTGFEDMLGLQLHPSVPRLIAKRASRHPAFVQQFCRCLLEHVSKRRSPGSVVTITKADVDEVYNTNINQSGGEQAFINYFNDTLGYNLSHLGHAILLAFTDPELYKTDSIDPFIDKQEILSLLNQWCELIQIQQLDLKHFEQTIELLQMTNMLTEDQKIHGRYRATYPTHLDILKRLDKINKTAIEDSLKAYDDIEREKGILL